MAISGISKFNRTNAVPRCHLCKDTPLLMIFPAISLKFKIALQFKRMHLSFFEPAKSNPYRTISWFWELVKVLQPPPSKGLSSVPILTIFENLVLRSLLKFTLGELDNFEIFRQLPYAIDKIQSAIIVFERLDLHSKLSVKV